MGNGSGFSKGIEVERKFMGFLGFLWVFGRVCGEFGGNLKVFERF